jgi:hypothetical protein
MLCSAHPHLKDNLSRCMTFYMVLSCKVVAYHPIKPNHLRTDHHLCEDGANLREYANEDKEVIILYV